MDKNTFLRKILEIKEVSLATISEENTPSNRIIDMMYEEDSVLYFLTAIGKRIYTEISKNPYVAISTYKDKQAYTITGKAIKAKESYLEILFQHNPFMYDLYPDNTKKILKVFYISDWDGEYINIGVKPVVRYSFSIKDKNTISKKGKYNISTELCDRTGECLKVCPTKCIDIKSKLIIQNNRLRCGAFLKICPNNAIKKW